MGNRKSLLALWSVAPLVVALLSLSGVEAGDIKGAVAVMPTEPIGMDFLIADATHHMVYEEAIHQALEEDGRLALVDRRECERVIKERKLHLLDRQTTEHPPVVAADVLVIPNVILLDKKSRLRLEAVHTPTASTLGTLQLAIDPDNPAEFSPPLKRQVALWWPEVLSALERVRNQPRWYLLDVYCDRLEEMPLSETIFNSLQETLKEDKQVFYAQGPVLSLTQQELVMQIMGMSQDQAGGFLATFDYLVDAKIQSENILYVRVRDGLLNKLGEKSFVHEDPDRRMLAAKQWLAELIEKHPEKIISDEKSLRMQRKWAHLQSRLEYNKGFQLSMAILEYEEKSDRYVPDDERSALSRPYSLAQDQRRRAGIFYWRYLNAARKLAPSAQMPKNLRILPVDRVYSKLQDHGYGPAIPDKRFLSREQVAELAGEWIHIATENHVKYSVADRLAKKYRAENRPLGGSYRVYHSNVEQVDIARRRCWRHKRRAAQLDPTWEMAARVLTTPDYLLVAKTREDGRKIEMHIVDKERVEAQRYYLKRFPDSQHYELILYQYQSGLRRVGWQAAEGWLSFGLDRESFVRRHLKESVDVHFEFVRQYVLTNKISIYDRRGEARFQHYGVLLNGIDTYLVSCKVSPEEQEELIRKWARYFDTHPDKAPSSDFVRLCILSHRKDKAPFFALLRTLHKRWPDPKKLPWSNMPSDGGQHMVTAYCVKNCLFRLRTSNRRVDYDWEFFKWVQGDIEMDKLPWMRPDFELLQEKKGASSTMQKAE